MPPFFYCPRELFRLCDCCCDLLFLRGLSCKYQFVDNFFVAGLSILIIKRRDDMPAYSKDELKNAAEPNSSGKLAFVLVVIMLGILCFLVVVLICVAAKNPDDKILEFSKWGFSSLIGAFGAWIGAGAAYFFGRENFIESSRSTKEALEIQRESFQNAKKKERMRDLTLRAMNIEFMFNSDKTKTDVIIKLDNYPDYWWVPVMDKEARGILVDIVHARVFWDKEVKDDQIISDILKAIDKDSDKSKLHGPEFFLSVSPDDKISEVLDRMKKSGAAIGVVVDVKGKPSYCFTRQDIMILQK